RGFLTIDYSHAEAQPVPEGLKMTEPPLGSDRALRRFRVAVAAAEAAPSAASVASLREAALLLNAELRAAYVAAGSPYGDERAGMYRWLREVIGRRDIEPDEMQSDR